MPQLYTADQVTVEIRMFLANWAIEVVSKQFDFSDTRAWADQNASTAQTEQDKLEKHRNRVKGYRDRLDKFCKDPSKFRDEKDKDNYMYEYAVAAIKKESGNCFERSLSGLVTLSKKIKQLKTSIEKEIKNVSVKTNEIHDEKSAQGRSTDRTDMATMKEIPITLLIKTDRALNNNRNITPLINDSIDIKSIKGYLEVLNKIQKNLDLKIAMYEIRDGEHIFTILGDYPHDPNAVLCDIWAKKAYLASDAASRLHDFDASAEVGKRLKPYDPKNQDIIPCSILNEQSPYNSIQTWTIWPKEHELPEVLKNELDSKPSEKPLMEIISVFRKASCLGIELHSSYISAMLKDPKQVEEVYDLVDMVHVFLSYQTGEEEQKKLMIFFANHITNLLQSNCKNLPEGIYKELFYVKQKNAGVDNDEAKEECSELVNKILQSKIIMNAFSKAKPDESFLKIMRRIMPHNVYNFLIKEQQKNEKAFEFKQKLNSVFCKANKLGVKLHSGYSNAMLKDPKQVKSIDDLLDMLSQFESYAACTNDAQADERKKLLDFFINRIKNLLEQTCEDLQEDIKKELFCFKEKSSSVNDEDVLSDSDIDDEDELSDSDIDDEDEYKEAFSEFIEKMFESKAVMDSFSSDNFDESFSKIMRRVMPYETYTFLCDKAETCDICICSHSELRNISTFGACNFQSQKTCEEKYPLLFIIEKEQDIVLFKRKEYGWEMEKKFVPNDKTVLVIKDIWQNRKNDKEIIKMHATTKPMEELVKSNNGRIKKKYPFMTPEEKIDNTSGFCHTNRLFSNSTQRHCDKKTSSKKDLSKTFSYCR